MRYFIALAGLALTVALCWTLDRIRFQEALPLAPGRMLDPFHGFWQNMASPDDFPEEQLSLPGLKDEVTVHYDERRVPHIFARNDHDLYFAQGYVTAADRLWQMDFQTRFAAGRLSEVLRNPAVLDSDRLRRRTGMVKAAETALATMEKDPVSKRVLDAYAAGINAWIDRLSYADYPFEYKLLDFAPEAWTNLKTSLLLKMMAWDLTGRSEDFEQTAARQHFGGEAYRRYFPEHSDSVSPIIPGGTAWEFEPVAVDTPDFRPEALAAELSYPRPPAANGSNNWVLSGKKTASGFPILCNDPHLGLRLPSIWYEIQLSTPDHNVYGVSLPGAPAVIIGFNGDVAWGVTNASRDVLDWYRIAFTDAGRTAYSYDGGERPTETRIEEIGMRGGDTFRDTVLYTHHGPVVFDRNFGDPRGVAALNVAMRWAAHDPGNELLTFYMLNRAKSYADYREALRSFACPGQNFVFAARDGDIAITQNGRFPVKWPGQGQFVMDGADPGHEWQALIPFDHNPIARNPERGYLFSSNQHAADTAYPYRLDGNYDHTRNRRIDRRLSSMKNATVGDMQALQNDNFNQLAAEVLPRWIALVDISRLDPPAREALDKLRAWDLVNDPGKEAPTLFEFWRSQIFTLIWADEAAAAPRTPAWPESYLLAQWSADTAEFPLIDRQGAGGRQVTRSGIVTAALLNVMPLIEAWRSQEENKGLPATWRNYNDVTVRHLARLAPYTYDRLETGGNSGIVNANHGNHGASWRMIVELGPEPVAFGVFPGGQSGNPGDPNFDHMIDDWAAGRYFPLHYLKPGAAGDKVAFTQTLQPASE